MKFKNILAAALTIGAALTAAAQTDPSQLRIYVNPGHGSWTGGDRAMATIKHGPYNGTTRPDTTGFFESNTNMWKGLSLHRALVSYGLKYDPTLNQDNPNPARRGAALDMTNNVVMSHVKLGPFPTDDEQYKNAYNRNLYEICCEVERNNFDFFISVHSNAHQDGSNTNYPAFFVRGENKVASVPGSDEAAAVMWPYAYQDEHQCWSYYSMTNPGIYYDIDFWNGDYLISTIDGKQFKGYYGVLRHGVKGFILEGYFHTYQPGRHRALNPDVCAHEGLCYAHGLAAVYGLPMESTGELYGIVRDRNERFIHQYYHSSPTGPDANKPINNAVVNLYRDGQKIDTYITDDEWNGAFIFPALEPGEYTISVTAEGYLDAEPQYCGPFTVEAAKCTYPRVFLTAEDWVPPVYDYSDYPDPAGDAEITVADAYQFKRTYTDKTISAVKNKTVKRMLYRNDRIYVLSYDADAKPYVTVLAEKNFVTLAKVSVEGVEGSERSLADIQLTGDGVLLGVAMELCHNDDGQVAPGETRGECKIFRWDNDYDTGLPVGNPRVWFTTQTAGNFNKALTGRTMAYTGTTTTGRMVLSSASTEAGGKINLNVITIAESAKGAETIVTNAQAQQYLNAEGLGEYTFSISPLGTTSFITGSSMAGARQFAIDGATLEGTLSTDIVPANSEQAGFFRLAGRSYMVAPDVNTDGNCTGIVLMDITEGLDKAKVIATEGCTLEPKEGIAAATGRAEVDKDEDGNVTEVNFTLYLLRNNGRFTRMTTRGVEQNGIGNITIEANEAPAEYYNLQGMRVQPDMLTPGIYIRRQGTVTSKVTVR